MEHEYLPMFLEESNEHLQALNDNVLNLESNPENIVVVGEIFRSAHTFKGMSATMGFSDIVDLTHEMENVLDLIRNGKMNVHTQIIDVIFECIDNLEKMVNDIASGGTGQLNVSGTVTKLKNIQSRKNDIEGKSQEVSSDTSDFKDNNASHLLIVEINEDALLKSVRGIMVLDALNELGDVTETIPALELIEKEEFDTTIKIALSSKSSNDEIKEVILKITDVKSVEVINPEFKPTTKTETNIVKVANNKKEVEGTKKASGQTIRVNIEKIEDLMNMFEETVIERGRINEIATQLNNSDLNERLQRLDNVSKELQNIVLNMRMVPVEIVFNRFPRMVRSLAKDLGKSIDLKINGEDTEIDRIVIDEIGDPLVHLIRNSVDHGIETKEARAKSGKNPVGTVVLEAFHSGNNVVIQITDDGGGINKDRVLSKAIKNKLITETDSNRLSDSEVYDLLFQPGFSTADTISDISGRGVGLDVVKTTITKLGGSLTVTSQEGKGSTFRIELPLTLSIIQTMLVETNGIRYAFPLGTIVESIRINVKDAYNIKDKYVFNYRDKTIQINSLNEVFYKRDSIGEATDWLQVVIVKNNDKVFAVAVDKILGQREIVLKSLGNFFKDSNNYFSGATILGDGRVVLIVDVDKLGK